MQNNSSLSFTMRVLISIAAAGLALMFMREGAELISSLFLAWIIVLVASPLLHWLVNKGAPVWLSFALTLIAILAVFAAFTLVLVVAMDRFIEEIPQYAGEIETTISDFQETLSAQGLITPDSDSIFSYINPEQLLSALGSFISGLFGTVSNLLLLGLLVIFLLLDAFNAPEKLAEEIKSGNAYLQRYFQVSESL
jgi:predicted PurR-regulated permease PerM